MKWFPVCIDNIKYKKHNKTYVMLVLVIIKYKFTVNLTLKMRSKVKIWVLKNGYSTTFGSYAVVTITKGISYEKVMRGVKNKKAEIVLYVQTFNMSQCIITYFWNYFFFVPFFIHTLNCFKIYILAYVIISIPLDFYITFELSRCVPKLQWPCWLLPRRCPLNQICNIN